MKKLYYATFERGLSSIVELFIKKQDKNSFVKKMYDDAVLFMADEHFPLANSCFKATYLVIDHSKKEGVGAINVQMKKLLEKKDLKIYFPKEVSSFKLTFLKENENTLVDSGLKKAFETMLRRVTKKQISFYSASAELVVLAKKDGECLFMKKLPQMPELLKVQNKVEISPDVAHALCFLSEPATGEVVLDPFAEYGMISYVRALCFKKANVIANEENEQSLSEIKKKAKSLKDKHFSVMNYNFLSDKFPIRFIDKIVTVLPGIVYGSLSTTEFYRSFFEKVFNLNVKTMVVMVSKSTDINRFIDEKFEIEFKTSTLKFNIFKLKHRG